MRRALAAPLLLSLLPTPASADAPAGPFLPDEPRLTPVLSPAVDRALSRSPAWRGYVEAHPGWQAIWDARTGRPRRAFGPGMDLCREVLSRPATSGEELLTCLRPLLRAHPELFGAEELTVRAFSRSGARAWLSLQQMHRGIPVTSGQVEMRFIAGELVVWGAQTVSVRGEGSPASPTLSPAQAQRAAESSLGGLRPQRPTSTSSPRLTWLEEGGALRLCWRVEVAGRAPVHHSTSWVDAHTGEVLAVYDHLLSSVEGRLSTVAEERTVTSPMEEIPLAGATVWQGEVSTVTDGGGAFSLEGEATSGELRVEMAGPWAFLKNEDAEGVSATTFLAEDAAPGPWRWEVGATSQAELSAWVAFHEVRDYFITRRPGNPWAMSPVPLTVNADMGEGAACNAFFAGPSGLYFLLGYEDESFWCANLAQVKDVVYHEYGHGVHAAVLAAGVFDAAVSEGSADYLAATILDDPWLAPDAFGIGTWLREIETDARLPDDLNLDTHVSGLIWASALWDLREDLIFELGFEAGRALADDLFLTTLAGGPTLYDLYPEILFADDDDADLSNGTPHGCTILAALGPHGLGPGTLGLFDWGHTPVTDQSAETNRYRVEVAPTLMTPECSTLDTRSLTLYYRVGQGAWTPVAMQSLDGHRYKADIPKVAPGSTVSYDVMIWDRANGQWASLSGGRPDLAPSFYVGALEEIFCDDFEQDRGWVTTVTNFSGTRFYDWQRGAPAGKSFDPAEARSGQNIYGTNLGNEPPDTGWSDGEYHAAMTSILTSPPLSTRGHHQVRLRYARWLSVEDAIFDQADIVAGDQLVWRNLANSEAMAAGGGAIPTIDAGWVHHSLPLPDVDDLDAWTLSFVLSADSGLQYGGWNIDDVCVVAPADLEDRYRAASLRARLEEGDERPTLTFTHPWVWPLAEVRVVRKAGAIPADPGDGALVASLDQPPAGEEATLTDPLPFDPEGTIYTYRVFASDGERWYPEEPKEGHDLARLGHTALASPSPEPDDEEPSGCDSRGGGGFGMLGGVLIAGALRPRRRQ